MATNEMIVITSGTSNLTTIAGVSDWYNGTCSTGYFNLTDNNTCASQYNAGIILKRDDKGISPNLYFSYIKSKFGVLQRRQLNRRIKEIEKAFDEAVDAGQNMLAEKVLKELEVELKESVISAKGIKYYIEKDDLMKHKRNIRDGHISDTILKDYTRIVPKKIRNEIANLQGIFDDFIVFHYYNSEIEQKTEKKQKMSLKEKEKMRDPVLFGIIKETDRYYFIDEWDDEYCDLSFGEIIKVMGKQSKKQVAKNKVNFNKNKGL